MGSNGLPAGPGATAARLRLRPLRPADEPSFWAAHELMAAEGVTFGLGLEPGMPWMAYLRLLADHHAGAGLPDRYVPATFLVADVDGEIVGRASIRHRLSDFLVREGGHIGYCVLPAHRRRGYGTEILRQGLVIARAIGVGRTLVTCDDGNFASAAIIETCGGRLESVGRAADGRPVRRYWID